MAKATHGYNRTVKRTVRLSEDEDRELVKRQTRGSAKTPSAYLRFAALHGREFEMPAHETLRDLRNVIIRLINVVSNTGTAKTIEDKAEAALDRISQF